MLIYNLHKMWVLSLKIQVIGVLASTRSNTLLSIFIF